jgi:DNA-binding CsgD family transcriptional regulator/tetratricopeptide (TPR) repeat protein
MGGRVASPTFVGRVEELQTLEAARGRAANGEPAVVLVGGEAGVGKTRLVGELTSRCVTEGTRVLVGGCVPVGDGALPYAPIVEALRTLLADLSVATVRELVGPAWPELARLLPALGEPDNTVPAGQAAQTRLFELLLGLLGRLGEQAPLVWVVEDLHWADSSTLDLLAFLVRNLRRERVLVAVTYRNDEPGHQQRLGPYLAELDRVGRVQRLELPRLDRGQTAAQLTGILGAAPAADLVDGVFARSEGNPFFTEELLATVRTGSRKLPTTLADLLRGRVQALPQPTQQVLAVVAVAGRTVPHRLLTAVADLDDADLTSALQTGVAQQLLVSQPQQDGYDLRHGLLREVIDADLLPGERAALHAAYARVLAGRSELADRSPAVAAAELAAHWQAAGDRARALPALVAAGRAAGQAHAFPEAHRLYEQALALWNLVDDPQQLCGLDRVGLLERAAEAAGLAGRVKRAVALANEGLEGLDEAADPVRAAELLLLLGQYHWSAGDEPASLAAYDQAVQVLPDQPSPELAGALAAHAQGLLMAGRGREAGLRAEHALAVARAVGARSAEAHALDMLGSCMASMGEVETGIAYLIEARRLAEQVGSGHDLVRASLNLGVVLSSVGRVGESLEVWGEGYQVARRYGIQRGMMGSVVVVNLADMLFQLGRWEEVDRLLGQALEYETAAAFRLHRVKGRLELARGRFTAARDELELALQRSPSTLERFRPVLWLAELAIWQGRHEDAHALLAQARSSWAGANFTDDYHRWQIVLQYALELRLEADCAELARARHEPAGVDEARRQAGGVIGELRRMTTGRGQAKHTLFVLVHCYPALCEAEFSRVEGRSDSDRWRTVAALWDEFPCPYEAAYARYRQAEALLAGRMSRQKAETVLRAAHQTTVELGAGPLRREIALLAQRARLSLEEPVDMAATPEASPSPAASLGLTRRETEVLALVAEGRTNRQIGQALFITEKTASLHVSHILAKLGVAGRGEAAAIAHRLGLDKQ